MHARPVFSELLDEKLRAFESIDAEPVTPRTHPPFTPPVHPLLFATPYSAAHFHTYPRGAAENALDAWAERQAGWITSPSSSDGKAGQDSHDVEEPRPAPAAHRLSDAEQQALGLLNGLGAGLSPAFSPRELRSAFRRLAHRYHPDRHAAGSAAERARLTRQFADIVECHRQLAAALDRPAARA